MAYSDVYSQVSRYNEQHTYTIYMYVHTYMYAYMVNISDCAIGTHEEESGILMRKSYQ